MADKAGGARQRRRAASSQRLTQLHVAYGNALIAARGYGAPETTEAFARARESAAGDKDAPERLAADYGLWVGSYVRGELAVDEGARRGLPQRRRGEARFARGRRRSSRRRDHALVRRRVSRGAGSSGTRARPVPTRPRRRSGLSLRTGPRRRGDGLPRARVVAARRGRARDFARSTTLQARIAGLTHIGTRAYGRLHAAMFELMRGDLARAAPNAARTRPTRA